MTYQEIEEEALKLPEQERRTLAERLMVSLGRVAESSVVDPIFALGANPVRCDAPEGASEHDVYLYEPPALP